MHLLLVQWRGSGCTDAVMPGLGCHLLCICLNATWLCGTMAMLIN